MDLATETQCKGWSEEEKKKHLVGEAIMSKERRCGRFRLHPSQKEGQKRGVKKERRAKCRQDQKSQSLGWVWERESMWMSVCGSAGRLTSGLHYKRKAQWGSADLSSKYKGVFVVPARNE